MNSREKTQTSFALYRWNNPECFHDYPLIAVATDRSVYMSLGDYGLCFDWGMMPDVARALAHHFAPIDVQLHCDFATLREVFDSVFAGGVRSGLVRFDPELRPKQLELSLNAQVMAEDGPEYLILELRNYQRLYREPVRTGGVTLAERAMLDVCTATFGELAAQSGELLREPPPPRYRSL